MAQYATTAKLFGYLLAPRPPDAVELAIDSSNYGVGTVSTGQWYRFPSTEELSGLGLNRMRRAVSSALSNLSDAEDALIIVTAGPKSIALAPSSVPSLDSPKWRTENFSGARVFFEDMLRLRSTNLGQITMKAISYQNDFLPPFYNPFILTSLSPPLNLDQEQAVPLLSRYSNEYLEQKFSKSSWSVSTLGTQIKMPFPRGSPEVNCRSMFVLQLLSSRPTQASAQEAAYGELWKVSYDAAAVDLAELGAPGGLAYELRFNRYGLRLAFLGLNKTLSSYSRRLVQLLVKHQRNLMDGPTDLPKSIKSTAVFEANKARNLPPIRKRIIIDTIQQASAYDIATEGSIFLNSCTGAICFSEGNLTEKETESLSEDLRLILSDSIAGKLIQSEEDLSKVDINIPSVSDISEIPTWNPRNASPCYVAGVSLISDACGRIPR